MLDNYGVPILKGDWIRSPYFWGKVTEVSEHSLSFYDEEYKEPDTVSEEEIAQYDVELYPYSHVRRRFLAGQLPNDFFDGDFNSTDKPIPQDKRYVYYIFMSDHIYEAIEDAGKDKYDAEVHTTPGAKEMIEASIAKYEDLADFMHAITDWFRTNV